MHSRLRSLSCVGGWALCLAGGCDDQAGPEYYGESLLTVTGSVEIANSQARGELSPALAFTKGPMIVFVDVPVRGNFPSSFRIEMHDAPPESVLHHPTLQEEGEPLAAISYIAAVTRDHPEKLYAGNSESTTAYGCKDEGRADKLCLVRTQETCPEPNIDKIPCYVEKRYCPTDDPEAEECIVETSGDPDLKAVDILSKFAGVSQNYYVIYLAEAAAEGSTTAAWLNSKTSVPAGYGLYEVLPITGDEAEKCFFEDSPTWKLATRYYNEAHGTNYKSVQCEVAWNAPHCTMPSEDLEGRTGPMGEVNRLLEKARIELGCPVGFNHYKRVEDPENTPISLLIDPALPSQTISPPTHP